MPDNFYKTVGRTLKISLIALLPPQITILERLLRRTKGGSREVYIQGRSTIYHWKKFSHFFLSRQTYSRDKLGGFRRAPTEDVPTENVVGAFENTDKNKH